MKALFDGIEGVQPSIISNQATAIKYIREIEIPCQLHLALCFLSLNKYHEVIYYTTQVIEKDETSQKAYYRRGLAYLHVGELTRSERDLEKANQLTNGTDPSSKEALKAVRERKARELEN